MKIRKIGAGLLVVGVSSLFAFGCPQMQNDCQKGCAPKESKCKMSKYESMKKMRSFMDLNLSNEQKEKIYQVLNDAQKEKFKIMQEHQKEMKECHDKCNFDRR